MTTPAHKTGRTAGPWSIRPSRDGSGDVGITANGVANVIAECFAAMRSSGENARDEALANARLISAAPDMLKALEKAEELYQVGILNAPDGLIEEVVELRRAALSASRSTGDQS